LQLSFSKDKIAEACSAHSKKFKSRHIKVPAQLGEYQIMFSLKIDMKTQITDRQLPVKAALTTVWLGADDIHKLEDVNTLRIIEQISAWLKLQFSLTHNIKLLKILDGSSILHKSLVK